jgi:hypothetical protein
MIEQSLLMREQPVMAGIELVDLRQGKIRSQKIRQRAAFEPLTVQPPLAPRRQQPVGHQNQQNRIPSRAFAARREPLRPEPVQLQLTPQRQDEPACAPLPRPAQPHLRQSQANDGRVRKNPFAAIVREQRQRPWLRGAFVKDFNRLAPRQLLRVIDLAEVEHMPLHYAPVGHALVLDNAEVAVLLAVLLPNHLAQEHAAE